MVVVGCTDLHLPGALNGQEGRAPLTKTKTENRTAIFIEFCIASGHNNTVSLYPHHG